MAHVPCRRICCGRRAQYPEARMRFRVVSLLAVLLSACSSKPNRMPKGFEKLKLGVKTAELLDILYDEPRWRDGVSIRAEVVGSGLGMKNLGHAQTAAAAMAKFASESDAVHEAL